MSGPIKDLQALKPLRKELAAQQRARKLLAAQQLRLTQQLAQQNVEFSQKIGPVFSLKSAGKVATHQPLPVAFSPQRLHRLTTASLPPAILAASLSDLYSIENLLDSDEHLRFARAGIGSDILPKLHKGHWAVRQQLDLHGLRIDQARDRLAEFVQLAEQHRWRCIRVIHGKGYGSVNQVPVLKGKVRDWLVQINSVVAFCQAREADGGAGAIVILLKAQARSE